MPGRSRDGLRGLVKAGGDGPDQGLPTSLVHGAAEWRAQKAVVVSGPEAVGNLGGTRKLAG